MKHLALVVCCDDGAVLPYLGIDYEGKIWLVPVWLIDQATGFATPERMIRVDSLSPRIQKCEPGDKFDYANIQLPKAVIHGVSVETTGYEVRSLPNSPRVHRSELKVLPSIFQ